jgi:hypothetical protein
MGVVYAAQQERHDVRSRIKVLRRGFRHPQVLRRFEREAEMLGRLQHPGIANVYAFYRGDGRVPAHLVMELVSGPPITEYVQAHGLGARERIELVIAVCLAVQHAHERGIIHRDLKPANVLVSDTGAPKVLDFGIARAIGLDLHSSVQTAHGQLIGTLAYMSPERLLGATDVDGRSDVYALGVMFYRLMAGRLPFDVVDLPLGDAAQRILYSDVPPLGSIDSSFAGPIEQVARRAMAPDPDRRYQSAADLAADLRACLEGRSLSATVAAHEAARVPQLHSSWPRASIAVRRPQSRERRGDRARLHHGSTARGRSRRRDIDPTSRVRCGWTSRDRPGRRARGARCGVRPFLDGFRQPLLNARLHRRGEHSVHRGPRIPDLWSELRSEPFFQRPKQRLAYGLILPVDDAVLRVTTAEVFEDRDEPIESGKALDRGGQHDHQLVALICRMFLLNIDSRLGSISNSRR